MKFVFVILVSLFVSVLASAQSKGWTPEKSAKQMTGLWVEQCSLNAEQEEALGKILLEKQKEMFAARKELKGQALTAKTKEVNRKYSKSIREAVGVENTKKMNSYWASRKK